MTSRETPGRRSRITLALAFLAATACGGSDAPAPGSGPAFDEATAAAFVATYADIMHANYNDVVLLAEELQTAINAFVGMPTEPNLAVARMAWVTARPFYQQTEVGRFYDGPIDRDPDGPEIFINAWPLDEVHIDYVSGMAMSGIINDPITYPTIDEMTIRNANEMGGEANISAGWHAIEFLLWGQDMDAMGPGARPATDYDTGMGGTAANQDRRGTYLMVAAQMLVDDLTYVRDEWAPGTGAYRAELLGLPVETALSRIMTGMGTLGFGELRGERLIVPFTTKLQEDEHSCFSDTTHDDHLYDVIGMRNVWLGEYVSSDGMSDVSGTGLQDVANSASAPLSTAVNDSIDNSVVALMSPDLIPFDQAILGADTDPGRVKLQEAIDFLSDFNDAFSALAAAMGVSVNTLLP